MAVLAGCWCGEPCLRTRETPQQRVGWRWGLESTQPEDLLYWFPAECPALESCLMHSRPSGSVLTERLETVLELPGDSAEVHLEGVPGLNPLGLENGTVLPGGLAHRRFGSEGAKGGPGQVQGRGRAGWGAHLAPGQGPRGRRGVAGLADGWVWAPPSSLWPEQQETAWHSRSSTSLWTACLERRLPWAW